MSTPKPCTDVRVVSSPDPGSGTPGDSCRIGAEVAGTVGVGVVLNVRAGELWTATSGSGAHLTLPGRDPVPLTGSRPASLEQTLVATGFGYGTEQRRAQGAVVAELLPLVRD